MTRYTEPGGDEPASRHPRWMRAVAWLCLAGVLALLLANAFRL
ncbi:hypothetical protein BH24ACT3_BH24ACT3_05450 [soil metagenome]